MTSRWIDREIMRQEVDEIFQGYDLNDPQLEKDLAFSIVNWLDRRNLEKLYFYLYRIDVNEDQVRTIIDSNDLNSEKSILIARLMIQRQINKLENRS